MSTLYDYEERVETALPNISSVLPHNFITFGISSSSLCLTVTPNVLILPELVQSCCLCFLQITRKQSSSPVESTQNEKTGIK